MVKINSSTESKKFEIYSKALGAILLISGTSIGGGIFALPVITAPMGIIPSLFIFLLTWSFMTFTAFLMLEATLATNQEANLISMSRKTLGIPGEGVAWISYLLLLYSLMATYITGLSSLIKGRFETFFFKAFPVAFLPLLVTLFVVFFCSLRY